jgi:hypothetical protein
LLTYLNFNMGLGRVSIPSNPSFQQTAKVLNDLVPRMKPAAKWLKEGRDLANEFSKFKKDYTKTTHEIKTFQRKTKPAVDFFTKQRKNLEGIVRKFPGFEKGVKAIEKTNKEIKAFQKRAKPAIDFVTKQRKSLETFIKKLPAFEKSVKVIEKSVKGIEKLTTPISKALGSAAASKIVGAANFAFGIAGVGLGLGNLWLSGELSKSTQNQIDLFGREAARTLRISIKQANQIKQLEKREKINSADLDRLSKATGEIRIYVNKQLTNFQIKLDTIKKQANDALYEVRAGRKILEPKIAAAAKSANDALYEVRAGRKILESKIATADKKGNDALYEVRAGRKSIDSQLQRIPPLEAKVNNLIKNGATGGDKLPANILDKINKAATDASKALLGVGQIPATINKEIQSNVIPSINRTINAKLEEIRRDTALKLDKKLDKDKFVNELQQNSGSVIRIIEPYIKNQIKPYIDATGTLQNAVGNLAQNVGDKIKIDNRQDRELDIRKADIDSLKERIRKQEKMNEDGNRKLEDLLKLTIGIPLLIQKSSDLTSTQTVERLRPEIPNLTAQGVCRTMQPGGCSRRALDDLGNSVNNNTNNRANNLLNAFNTGANAAQMALLTRIDVKLGAQIVGGISGKLVKGFEWLQLDRALNMLIFAATVQNHLMLSRDIGTTLLGAFSNVLTLIGIKDDSGQPLNIGNIINLTIENLVKGLVGAENYATLSENFAKANRIYQASTNVLNSFQNISSTILSGMELIGSYTGKIGNALKKGGAILDNAYGWMNPQPKFNRISQTLENLQQGASTIQQVTQAPLDVINAVTELQTANTELVKAIKEDNKPENKAPEIPEPDKLKADELAAKISSTISNILPDDLFNAAD